MRDDALVVENIRSGTCAAPNAAVERGNVSWCGPNSGASPAQPVGSTVDKVTIHPFHGDGQAIQVNVPNPAPGEFGWTIDGYNGLVDLGTAQERNGTYFQANGKINPILVSDSRRSLAPWSISANVGDFSGRRQEVLRLLPRLEPVRARRRRGCRGRCRGPVVARRPGQGPLGLQRARRGRAGHPRGGAKLGADLDLKIPDSIAKGSYRTTLTITALSS